MNRKFVIIALLILLVGFLAIPMASAQFGGGDADNNDDDSDSDSDTEDSDSDTDDDSDSDDSSYSGGDSENNDEETSDDTDDSDTETGDEETEDSDSTEDESSYDGGDSENNEDEDTESDYDGGDSENNEEDETDFDGDDSENNEETGSDEEDSETDDGETEDDAPSDSTDSGEEDSSDEDTTSDDDSETQDPDEGEGDKTEETDETGGDSSEIDDGETEDSSSSPSRRRSGRTYYISPVSDEDVDDGEIEADINPDTIRIGESAIVSGTLTHSENVNQEVEVLINGDYETSTATDRDGGFEVTITPSGVGNNEVTLRADNTEATVSLRVTPTVSINSMRTSSERTPGSSIDVCADIRSQVDAEITLYHNNQVHDSKHGQGEVCFRPAMDEGRNNYRAVATVEGDQDEREIRRSVFSDSQQTTSPASTGGFFASETWSVEAVMDMLAELLNQIINWQNIF